MRHCVTVVNEPIVVARVAQQTANDGALDKGGLGQIETAQVVVVQEDGLGEAHADNTAAERNQQQQAIHGG